MASGKWKYPAGERGLAVRRQTGQGRIPEDPISQLLLLIGAVNNVPYKIMQGACGRSVFYPVNWIHGGDSGNSIHKMP